MNYVPGMASRALATSDRRGTREPSLLDYLRTVWRHKLLVLLTIVVAVGAVIGIDSRRHKVYQSNAQILLSNQGATGSAVAAGLSQASVATDLELIQSTPVKNLVTKMLHAPAPTVAASEVGATDVAQISVNASSPTFAAAAANAYARAYLRHETTSYLSSQLATQHQLQSQIVKVQAKIGTVSTRGSSATSSTSTALQNQTRLSNLESELSSLQLQLSQLQVATAQSSAGQLVTPAVADDIPISPKRTRDAGIAAAVGLLIGIAFALLRDFADDRIRSTEDLEVATDGAPAIGMVPEVKGWRDARSAVLISASEPRSPAAEAYRGLRTSVQFMALDDPVKTLLVTSPRAAEGKTTTAANLALAMADAGKRVILVDCDLRRPRIHAFFDVPNDTGLTSVLLDEIALDDAIVAVPDHGQLGVLPSGRIPPNPADLLSGPAVAKVLDALGQVAEVIILDSSPVLTVTDAAALAARADGVLLVAMAGVSTKKDLARCVESFRRVGARILGTALNRAPQSGPFAYSRYGYQYGYAYRPAHAHKA